MAERIVNFVVFLALTLITLGIYPLYFYVTRTQENIELLTGIKNELVDQRTDKSKDVKGFNKIRFPIISTALFGLIVPG